MTEVTYSYAMACKFVSECEFVEDRHGNKYGHEGRWDKSPGLSKKYWNPYVGLRPFDAPFKIIEDPSKQKPEQERSLTYEDALECEKVYIFDPDFKTPLLFSKEWGGWDIHTKAVFDLAVRRGYKMTRVS